MDKFYFARMTVWIVFAATLMFVGVWAGGDFVTAAVSTALFLAVALPLMLIGYEFGVRKAGNAASRLFHGGGTGEKDHSAVKAGMYNLARGYLQTSEHAKAEKEYLAILTEYPNEMDAHYYLGMLYSGKLDKPEKALMHFRKLNRKINNGGSAYQYAEAVREKIRELNRGLGKP